MKLGRLPHLVPMIMALIAIPVQSWRTTALAEGPSESKGPEVTTVGADPYVGPLPEELAKLGQGAVAEESVPLSEKEAPTQTVISGKGDLLTAEALAKLAVLLEAPLVSPPWVMDKLAPMEVPTIGDPELTPEEWEKRARELATPIVVAQTTAEATTAAATEAATEGATPNTNPRSGR